MLTYGDGVSDIDLKKLVSFHKEKGKYYDDEAVQPEGRFGALETAGDRVESFLEKPAVMEAGSTEAFCMPARSA
jgi:glucose-1-phosphate cytidylyltransferase